MKTYTQHPREQRYQIFVLKKMGHHQTKIAELIEVHKSTISRELFRNRGLRGYRAKQAHHLASTRRKSKAKPRIGSATWALIRQLLREEWSPEQVSGWLKREKGFGVSHEYIYQHILQDKWLGGDLYRHLRCKKKRKKRYGSYDRRGQIPNRISIDDRPAVVDSRGRYGDWEVDTIIGKGHERKSRLVRIRRVQYKSAPLVTQAVTDLLKPLANRVLTLTSDNGGEFARHETISRELKVEFYFAHPYSSWERGLNENTNGLIRQYFPKGRDFCTITDEEINTVMDKLNNRPRKTLNFKTPNQVFFNSTPFVALTT